MEDGKSRQRHASRDRWVDAAPWVFAFAALSGFAMLAADLAGWGLTGAWQAIDLGDIAAIFGLERVHGVLGILFAVPLSIALIVVSPLLFYLMVSVWERLTVRDQNSR